MTGWRFSEDSLHFKHTVDDNCKPGMGYVYAVKLKIATYSFVKIGFCKENPYGRFANFPKNAAKIFCVSPPHYNMMDNEEILLDHFRQYRVPRRAGARFTDSQPELFNMSLVYMFENMPTLNFETDLDNCEVVLYGGCTYYQAKKRKLTRHRPK